jgi:hypothetical protein
MPHTIGNRAMVTTPTVAALCVQVRSEYHTLPGVECYDVHRDVRTFHGGKPVVAHPPCREWSAFCSHQAKAPPGEKELGLLCAGRLRECGGVLEHPAHSRLFAASGLPQPGETKDGLWTVEVLQAWWGDSRSKRTWLCFSGIAKRAVSFPFRLHDNTGDRRRWQLLGSGSRSKTPLAMAVWLVDVARHCSQTA